MILRAFKAFVRVNRAFCEALTPPHYFQTIVFDRFRLLVVAAMARADINVVVDVGAGKGWHAGGLDLKRALGVRLIGVDVSAEEMRDNAVLDERLEADVCRSIPVEAQSADLITARAGVEHFPDNEAFVRNCSACLREGGLLIAAFTNKYAPFALINQILPHAIAKWLLRNLWPESEGVMGFKAYYDKTSYHAFKNILEKNGFVIREYYPSFFSSAYFMFFAPLYFASLFLDLMRFAVGSRTLASYHLFVAERASR